MSFTPSQLINVPTLAALRIFPYAVLISGALVYAQGSLSANDYGQGEFVWSATSAASDDGGTIINPTGNSGNGRWLRALGASGVCPEMWGAANHYSADNTAPCQSAISYGQANKVPVYFPAANYLVSTLNVSAFVRMTGAGMSGTTIYRITSFDATSAAAAGGSLPAGTYCGAVYAYNGSTLLEVQPFNSAVLSGSSLSLSLSWAAVATATDYVVYYSAQANLEGQYSPTAIFGSSAYSHDASTSTAVTISTLDASAVAPAWVSPIFNIASGAYEVHFSDITINGNNRATHGVYFADYPGSDFPYHYSLRGIRCYFGGAIVNQIYLGNRRFASVLESCEASGGWQSVSMYNGADHVWSAVSLGPAFDAGLNLSGTQTTTLLGCNSYFCAVGARHVGCINVSWLGGSLDSNSTCGASVDSASSGVAFLSVNFTNSAAQYDVYNNGSGTNLTGAIFRASGTNSRLYSVYNDTSASQTVVAGISYTNGTPYTSAFTNNTASLVAGAVSTNYPTTLSTADTLTATGTTQSGALTLAAQFNRVTGGSGGAGVVLPSLVAGAQTYVVNEISGGGAILVYPPGSAQFQNLGAGVGFWLQFGAIAIITPTSSVKAEVAIAQTFDQNVMSGASSWCIWGQNNNAYQGYGLVGGYSNTSNGYGAVAIGENCSASGVYAWATGYKALSTIYGKQAYASAMHAAIGDNQIGSGVLGAVTTGSAVKMTADNSGAPSSSNVWNLTNNSAQCVTICITGCTRGSGSVSASWTVTAHVSRGASASTIAIAGSPSMTLIGAAGAASSWTAPTLATDTTNGGLAISVTNGSTGTPIDWTAYVQTAEAA